MVLSEMHVRVSRMVYAVLHSDVLEIGSLQKKSVHFEYIQHTISPEIGAQSQKMHKCWEDNISIQVFSLCVTQQ